MAPRNFHILILSGWMYQTPRPMNKRLGPKRFDFVVFAEMARTREPQSERKLYCGTRPASRWVIFTLTRPSPGGNEPNRQHQLQSLVRATTQPRRGLFFGGERKRQCATEARAAKWRYDPKIWHVVRKYDVWWRTTTACLQRMPRRHRLR